MRNGRGIVNTRKTFHWYRWANIVMLIQRDLIKSDHWGAVGRGHRSLPGNCGLSRTELAEKVQASRANGNIKRAGSLTQGKLSGSPNGSPSGSGSVSQAHSQALLPWRIQDDQLQLLVFPNRRYFGWEGTPGKAWGQAAWQRVAGLFFGCSRGDELWGINLPLVQNCVAFVSYVFLVCKLIL